MHEQLTVGHRDLSDLPEKPLQTVQIPHHSDAVAEEQQGVERSPVEREHIGLDRALHTALRHHLHRFGTDVDGRNIVPLGLKAQCMEPGAGTDVEDATLASLQGEALDR